MKNGLFELILHQFLAKIAASNPHWGYFGICHQIHVFIHWVNLKIIDPDSLLKSLGYEKSLS
jgi:hypothetical protein